MAVALAIVATVLLTACDPGIVVGVENLSDADVYVFTSGSYSEKYSERRPDTSNLRDALLVRAGKASGITIGCYSDTTNWVVLVVNTEEIYARATTCGRWLHSNARVTVQGTSGAFQVSDSLGEDADQIPQDAVGNPTVLGWAFMIVTGVASLVGLVVAMFIAIRFFYRYYISKGKSVKG
jgi:hypothetical protein